MSTIDVRSSRDAAGAVDYILFGRTRKQKRDLRAADKTRAASYAINVAGESGASPADFVDRAKLLSRVHGRKIELYSYVLAFHPDEFDVTAQADLDRIRDVAVELAGRMHSADYIIAVHDDSAGGHGHAHILITNHDNLTGKSLQRFTSWRHGLRQLNDELMRDEGLRVVPSQPGPQQDDWELRREQFSTGGFEQVLGDTIMDALRDARSVDRDAFEAVLAEHGVTLAVTDRDGWSYKMRRQDNGKFGRKKASGLSSEFTADGTKSIFNIHANTKQIEAPNETGREATAAAAEYGDIGRLDLDAPRRRAADHEADQRRRAAEHTPADQRRSDLETDHGPGGQNPGVDHTALRHQLQIQLAERDAREAAERDRADAEAAREHARRQRAQRRRIIAEEHDERAEADDSLER